MVKNNETNSPVYGSTILIEGTGTGTASDKNGEFEITISRKGNYIISASHIGYIVQKKSVHIESDMTIVFSLIPTILPGQEVIITATRAKDRETPVAFSNLSRNEIESKYWAQDIPMLVNELPNVYSYSDNGNGIGYSYLKIRGFDQRRIGVMINGIPLNDAESHEVFWVDLPDIASSTQDIQIQRGVGNSLYGAAAFGGSVNLMTLSSVQSPGLSLMAGYGTFNTKKFSLAANSGMIDNTYNMYGRFSLIETDGYRKPSWSKLWSYFFGLTRFDENMITRINIFGGPEKSYLAYRGVTKEYLDGNISGNKENDRRINPFQYPNEIDNFYQPHYQLINEWQITDNLKLENSLFTFLGKGDYTQFRTRRDVREYDIPRFKIADSTLLPNNYYRVDSQGKPLRGSDGLFEVRRIDLIRKRAVNDIDYGWHPKLFWKHGNGKMVIGGEYRYHKGHHYGEVIWANLLPRNISHDWRYYDYVVPKTSYTIYLHELYKFSSNLTIMGDLQLRHHNLKLVDDKRYKVEFEKKYTFLSPRGGVNYNLSDNLNIFGNVSFAKREPAFKDIYNPQDYFAGPVNLSKNFVKDGDRYIYNGKELNPEKLLNSELGGGYNSDNLNIKLNLYWMDFRDEIISTGQIDDNGVPVSGNADKTLHRGIEFVGSFKPVRNMKIEANISINDDRFISHKEFVVTDWNTSPPTTAAIVYDRNRLAGFPEHISNFRLSYNFDNIVQTFPVFVSLHFQNVGRIYLDNTENKNKSIAPFSVINGYISHKFTSNIWNAGMEISLVANNILNKFYEAGGYVEEGTPYWIPAATRNFFFNLKINL